MKFIKDLLTGKDNDTYDIGRVSGLMGLLSFLGLEIYQVLGKGIAFDMQTFGIAFGVIITALGAALKLKAETEPHQ